MLDAAETTAFRHTYYSLFIQLLWREPSPDMVAALQDGIEVRIDAAAMIHPRLGEGWQIMRRFLAAATPEAVAAEFTTPFLGPFGPQVQPYASYYLTGHLFRGPLITLRGFLKQIGVEKQEEEFFEPEDVLAFELDVMRWLIGKHMTAMPPNTVWLARQAEFLAQHLLIWAPACAQDIEKAAATRFYRGVAMVLGGFLELERTLFHAWGLTHIASLEEARQRYGGRPMWQGPTFEVGSADRETPPAAPETSD